jgi:hypothetical protein
MLIGSLFKDLIGSCGLTLSCLIFLAEENNWFLRCHNRDRAKIWLVRRPYENRFSLNLGTLAALSAQPEFTLNSLLTSGPSILLPVFFLSRGKILSTLLVVFLH